MTVNGMVARRGLALLGLACLPLIACGDDATGNQNGNLNQAGICGDGTQDPAEQCDDGAQNSDIAPDTCRTNCRLSFCGDGVVDTGEACDEGAANSDRIANACRRDCQEASCGDGVIDFGEVCDDGGQDVGDGCDPACQVEPGYFCTGEPSVCDCARYRRGEGCVDCVVHVDVTAPALGADGETWETAFPRVQDGIDRASEQGTPCEVWVAEGRYFTYEHDQLDTITPRDDVTLLGGFAGGERDREERDPGARVTVLDGASAEDPDSRVFHVITAIGTRDATLDGFVITGGRALGLASNNDERGGGLLAYSAQVHFLRSAFVENSAIQHGGAVYGYASGGLRFSRTVFANNEASLGGAVHLVFSPAQFEQCTFQGNQADGVDETPKGGAVFMSHAAARFHRCRFLGNSALRGSGGTIVPGHGGAMRVDEACNGFQVLSSVFLGNLAGEVGGLDVLTTVGNVASSGLVANCTFAGNQGDRGSALRWVWATGGLQPPANAPLFSSLFVANSTGLEGDELATVGVPNRCLTQLDHCNLDPTCTSFFGDPGLVADPDAPLVESTWSSADYDPDRHQSRLVDNTQAWMPGALAGLYVHAHIGNFREWKLILENDATSIWVWGRSGEYCTGLTYRIVDLRLSEDSPAIDAGIDPAGDPALATDLLGASWTDDPNTLDTGDGSPPYVDIGAYELVP